MKTSFAMGNTLGCSSTTANLNSLEGPCALSVLSVLMPLVSASSVGMAGAPSQLLGGWTTLALLRNEKSMWIHAHPALQQLLMPADMSLGKGCGSHLLDFLRTANN